MAHHRMCEVATMDELERSTPEPDEARGKSRTAILILASLLSATVLMAPAAAAALAFTTEANANAQIRDISDPNQISVIASNEVQAPPDQALIDISAPLSLPVGGATLSALATFRSVVITTSSGGIIAFGTAEATTIIDPLLVTPVVLPGAFAEFLLQFDSGNAPMAVAWSANMHVRGAGVTFDHGRSGGVLFGPAEGEDFGVAGAFFNSPPPADVTRSFAGVVKPNRTIHFSVDVENFFQDPVNLSTNFRDSRLDFTFTATPVPGPSPLLLLVGGLAATALVYGRMFTAK
jgi:hypothetical protein